MAKNTNTQIATRPVDRLKTVMASPSVQQQFQNALDKNSNLFVASLIDLYASDTYLQQCEPAQVVAEALKAATLKLPINKSLGFAYIVPYKKQGTQIPQFQLGYKGMIQLAMRSGIYKYLNADVVYEGEYRGYSKLTGNLDLDGEKKSDIVIGYFAYIESVNGFKKSVFCTREDMEKHAQKYSKAYNRDSSPWQTEFDQMAIKTMLRRLLSKYGLMTVDMADGMQAENDFEEEYRTQANSVPLDMITQQPPTETGNGETIDHQTGEVIDSGPGDKPPPAENAPPFAVA
jgi:recombination protein RecT